MKKVLFKNKEYAVQTISIESKLVEHIIPNTEEEKLKNYKSYEFFIDLCIQNEYFTKHFFHNVVLDEWYLITTCVKDRNFVINQGLVPKSLLTIIE